MQEAINITNATSAIIIFFITASPFLKLLVSHDKRTDYCLS